MPRVADLSSQATQLVDAYDQLLGCWRVIHEQWQDSRAQLVEEEYVMPLGGTVRSTLDALHRVDDFLKRAQRECESYE